ncbi:MAG: glycine cleavage system protein GcvH [Chloroflexi bacterium]|nr:glycine cleavage system protein GcvH [Chloroflexota bacterium]MCH9037798.1 glycine cleavage system protein GcvH [Chloroflexota bacterium]MCI0770243.1 glycine cleavage system protein GcvH [Chloroflexota bacterium]MCI0790167.1 glycine cleavage system protein GcvH [Chloroflexota bacterium]MCI0796276.1 glycine cleavage system protein GcvH [Chloroflexota bacterium]
MNPTELKYSEEHEWVQVESATVVLVGITEFAAESLGDVVFVELPEVGAEVGRAEKMGEIESVKAVSDLYSPVSGKITERNEQVLDNPQLVNDAPFEAGWMIRVELSDPSQLDKLLSAEQYESFLASQD